MAYYASDFDSYRVFYWSQYENFVCTIYCIKQNDVIGAIRFFKGDNSPQNKYTTDGLIFLHYHPRHIDNILKILRYEKPLYLSLNTTNHLGYVATGDKEPIGEQEPQQL